MLLGLPLTVHWLVRGDLHVVLDQGGIAMLPDLSLMNKIEAIFKDARDNAARTGSHLKFLDWKKVSSSQFRPGTLPLMRPQ